MSGITSLFQYDFMRNAFLAVLIITPLFGILGTMIVNNKMAFFSDALGHYRSGNFVPWRQFQQIFQPVGRGYSQYYEERNRLSVVDLPGNHCILDFVL